MKKTSILLVFIVFSGIAFGQTLIDTTKIWNVVKCINLGPCWTESYKFEGDTLMNGTLYRKLWASTDSASGLWYYKGAFREDISGKVFTNMESEDILIYNFELEPGDDFTFQWYGLNINMHVDQVDSITLLNGETRKRIRFDDIFSEEWIEGVGSMFGLPFVAYPHYSFDMDHELNCFYDNGDLTYQNSNYGMCWYTTVGIEENQTERKWTFAPNPFETTCKASPGKKDSKDNQTIRLLNLQGTQVAVYPDISEATEIGGKLNKGFYIYQIIENGCLIQTGKLIKNP